MPDFETNQRIAMEEARRLVALEPVIFDVETTGLDSSAKIVSICIMNLAGDILFESLVNPGGPIPSDASRIHGITTAVVQGAPTWDLIHNQVAGLLAGNLVVSYNIEFDLRMLVQSAAPFNVAPFSDLIASVACIMNLYAEYAGDWSEFHGNYRFHKLTDAVKALGIPFDPESAHSARADAGLARKVLLNLAERGRMLDQLNGEVRELAKLRRQVAEAKSLRQEMLRELEQSVAWMAMDARLQDLEFRASILDETIRNEAATAWVNTGSKRPHPALGIRVTKGILVESETAVRAYCQQSLPAAFVLDWKLIEKHAKAVAATAPMPGLAIIEQPQVVIDRDLDAYVLPDPEPELELAVIIPDDETDEMPF